MNLTPMASTIYSSFFVILFFAACHHRSKKSNKDIMTDKLTKEDIEIESQIKYNIPDTTFISLKEYADGFAYDMKYATEDNFLKKKVYACDKCLIRKEVADALIEANDSLKLLGLHIKFFDCYRPVDVQKLMWKIYPDDRYVANPNTSGSIHNRGGAVDITLVDKEGNELDMGTPFDYFGKRGHHEFNALPDTVLNNRQLLKTTMETFGFNPITTEWWHYNFHNAKNYALSNFKTACD